ALSGEEVGQQMPQGRRVRVVWRGGIHVGQSGVDHGDERGRPEVVRLGGRVMVLVPRSQGQCGEETAGWSRRRGLLREGGGQARRPAPFRAPVWEGGAVRAV